MRYKNKAFTLSELLIALGIIGVIATLSIPSIVSTIQYNILATQLKNNVVAIQQIIDDQKVEHKTKDLHDTDFKSSESFYSIMSKAQTCSGDTKCWGDSYRTIDGSAVSSYDSTPSGGIKLKNGATISYIPNDVETGLWVGTINVDVNGPEQPNIIGRDRFQFGIAVNGKIVGVHADDEKTCSDSAVCFDAIMKNNWKMPEKAAYYNKSEETIIDPYYSRERCLNCRSAVDDGWECHKPYNPGSWDEWDD
ncbi:MAG: type II secretion system protein [Cyanobacteriota bacterium]|nr:type II secretion system protein [Cyanobacteriota bacterium]